MHNIVTNVRKADVVIVCWNAQSIIFDCVKSVLSNKKVGKVILVDNASTDATHEQLLNLKEIYPNINIIRNIRNVGFGTACNQAQTLCESEYILLLNPDILVTDSTIDCAIYELEKHHVQVLGIRMYDELGLTHRSCARYPTLRTLCNESSGLNRISSKIFPGYLMKDWDHKTSRTVEHVIGAFYLTSNSLYEELGGMDEKFFVYYEDLDFSRRVTRRGGILLYSAECVCYHEGGGSSKSIKAIRTFYAMDGRIKYAFKHLGFLKGILYLMFLLTIERLVRSLYFTLKKDYTSVKETQSAYNMLIMGLLTRQAVK